MILEWIDAAAAIAVSAFVNGLWMGAVLACGGWAVIGLISKRQQVNPTTRYVVWATVLVLCVGLVFWRGWEKNSEARQYVVEASVSQTVETSSLEAELAYMDTQPVENEMAPPAELQSRDDWEESTAITATAAASKERLRITGPALSLPGKRILFGLWGVVTAFLLLRIFLSLGAVIRLKRVSLPAPREIERVLDSILDRIKRPRRMDVALSYEIETAVAVGFFQPMILLPASMPASLNETELEQVLVHEAAHIQRWDDWTMLLQRMAAALFFLHPGILLMGRLMDRDREFACDDWVVALTRRPKAYASCLAKLMTSRVKAARPVFAPGFSTGKKQLFERVETILKSKSDASFAVSWKMYVSLVGIIALSTVYLMRTAPVMALPDRALENHTSVETIPVEVNVDSEAPAAIRDARSLNRVSSPAGSQFLYDEPATVVGESSSAAVDSEVNTTSTFSATISIAPVRGIASLAPVETTLDELPLPHIVEPIAQPRDDDRLSKQSMIRLLKTSERIAADGDKTQILIKAASRMIADPDVFAAFLNAASTISASGDRVRALTALLKAHDLDSKSAIHFLKTAANIPSSGDKTRVLLFAIESKALPLDQPDVSDAFIDALETIPSSNDYKRVATRLLDRG